MWLESTRPKYGRVGWGPERTIVPKNTDVAEHWGFVREVASRPWRNMRRFSGRRYQALDFMRHCACDVKPKRKGTAT